ncbi:hypothetical protein LCALPC37_0422 [Lacticaseibacillus paracasei]|nr:hypothetical protein LCALPC37_0422 [Lacticaseibacillus paracasei]
MIRRDYPKGESLDDVSPSQVLATQDRLNGLPRRKLDYRSPRSVLRPKCAGLGVQHNT